MRMSVCASVRENVCVKEVKIAMQSVLASTAEKTFFTKQIP